MRVARIAASALAVVSVIAVDPAGLVPYGPLRWVGVTAVLLTAVAAVRGPIVVPRWLVTGWVLVLAGMALGTALALDPVHAWIGTPDRRLGLLSWVGFAAACAVGASLGRGTGASDHQDEGASGGSIPRTASGAPHAVAGAVRSVLRGAVVAGLCLAAGGVLDALGLLPADGVTGRLGGTYGQPAYLAAMGTLLLPLAIAIAADVVQARPWRWAAGVGAVGVAVVVLASGTRGAWVGLGVAGLLGMGPAMRLMRRRPRVAVAVLGVALAVALVTPIGARVAAGLDLSQGTSAGRLAEWAMAADVIADHPLGVGPEGYRIAFPARVDADYGRVYGREILPDRAHDGLLDVTATGGVVAGAGWLVLLAGVAVRGWRAVRSGEAPAIGIGMAVVAYGAQQLLLFPLAEVDPVWWLLIGLLIGWRPVAPEVPGSDHAEAVGASAPGRAVAALSGRASLPLGWPVRAVALALLGAVLAAGALGVVADRRMARAAALTDPSTTVRAATLAARAAELRPDDIRLWFAAARVAEAGGRIIDVDAALDRIDRGLSISPRDPALTAERARLLLDRARRSGLPGDADLAIAAHRDLAAADPANALPRLGLAEALLQRGLRDQAADAADAAADLDPEVEGLAALRALLALPPPGED